MKSVREQFNHRVWTAFSRLIEKRYHRNIGFSPAMSAEYLGKDYILNNNGDLVVPLFAGDHFLGAIKVKQGGTLENQEVKTIQAMFHKVGTALLDASESLNKIESDEDTKERKKISINLIGGGFEARHKLASSIHETLGSWSLVPWTDAGIAHWNTDDMEDLADICIYVRDIFELTPQEQKQLLTLGRLPQAMRPHLIVGSYRPLADYVEEKSVDPEIAALFSEASIFVDQMPKDYLRLQEVLEMLFEIDDRPLKEEKILI